MEIRNIKLLVQDTGKFQIPDEKWQGRGSPREHGRAGSFVNSSLDSVGQEDSAPKQPQGRWRLRRYKAAIHPGTPSFLRTSAHRGARACHSLTSNSSITYLAHRTWTNLPTYTKWISSEYTKRAGTNKIQLVPRLGIFINNMQNSKQQRILLYRQLQAYNLCLQRGAALGDATHKHFCVTKTDRSSPSKYLGLVKVNHLQLQWDRWSIVSQEILGR